MCIITAATYTPHIPKVIGTLATPGLHGVLQDAAVWVCTGEEEVHKLDTLCFGNLDGGAGTAAEVSGLIGVELCRGTHTVRLGLEEAFFLAHALGILSVHVENPLPGAADSSTLLDREVGWQRAGLPPGWRPVRSQLSTSRGSI